MQNIIGYGWYITKRSWNVDPIPIVVRGYNRVIVGSLAFPVAIPNPRKSFRALLYQTDNITRTDTNEFALPDPENAAALHQLFYRKQIDVYQDDVKHVAWIYLLTNEAARLMSITSFIDSVDKWAEFIEESGIGNIFPELLESI